MAWPDVTIRVASGAINSNRYTPCEEAVDGEAPPKINYSIIMRSKCQKCIAFSLMIIGISLLVAGITVTVLGSFKNLMEGKIKESVPLKAGSTSFERWEKPEGDLFIEYYVFNITNFKPAGVPVIKEHGPYTYRKVSFNNVTKREGQLLSYDPSTTYFFDPNRSCKTCDPLKDKVKSLNYPLLLILGGLTFKLLQETNLTTRVGQAAIINGALAGNNINLYQYKSVHELLWGYNDEVFSTVAKSITGMNVPQFYALQFNSSGSGPATIHTGEHDVNRVAELIEWKTFRTLPYWNSPEANKINGTGGTRYGPFIEKNQELFAFVFEICRSLELTYDSAVKVHDIELYRFSPSEHVFVTGDKNSNNKGFCVTGQKKQCLSTGLIDINACKGGPTRAPPFVASAPHFYHGHPELAQVFNLEPKKEKHATFIDIEPNTGVTMQAHNRLQLNIAVPNFSVMNTLLKVNSSSPVILPIFYTDESAVISEDDASDFKRDVLLPLRVVVALPYVMIASGALFLLICIIIVAVHRNKAMVKKSNLGSNGYENEVEIENDASHAQNGK